MIVLINAKHKKKLKSLHFNVDIITFMIKFIFDIEILFNILDQNSKK